MPSPDDTHGHPTCGPQAIQPGDNLLLRLVKWWKWPQHQHKALFLRAVVLPIALFASACGAIIFSWFGPQGIAVVFIIGNASHRIIKIATLVCGKPARTGLSLMLTALAICELLTVFAVIYYRVGITPSDKSQELTMEASIYFSIITWTTVGYGDWVPTPAARPFVCIQALFGYVFMGILISVFASAIQSFAANSKNAQKGDARELQ